MHNCPDCGEECDCKGDLGVDMHCEHVCKTPEDIEYDQDVDGGLFEDVSEEYDIIEEDL